jgi:DNA-binding GntR family transcriptional regulator
MEFQRTTNEFFMTDAQMAEQFGVSAKTISRALDRLESLEIIKRETKTVSSKRIRNIKFNQEAVERLVKQ